MQKRLVIGVILVGLTLLLIVGAVLFVIFFQPNLKDSLVSILALVVSAILSVIGLVSGVLQIVTFLGERGLSIKTIPGQEQQAREQSYIDQKYRDVPSEDQADRITNYLEKVPAYASRPLDEEHYVPLASDLKPLIKLESQPGPGQTMDPKQKPPDFRDLDEALQAINPRTQQPYPAFALLGAPGSGKSTLLRKQMRQAVLRRKNDPQAPLPLFVELNQHQKDRPIVFLRDHFCTVVGYDGLLPALNAGRIWLFADGLNEMSQRGYDERVQQWRNFLHTYFQGSGNRAILTCRTNDYGDGLGIDELHIRPLDDERIKVFLKNYTKWHDKTWQNLERNKSEERPYLYELAQIPFWLVMMSVVAGPQGLPTNRAWLIEQAIQRWIAYEADLPNGIRLDQAGCDLFYKKLNQMGWYGLPRADNYIFPRQKLEGIFRYKESPMAENLKNLAFHCDVLVEMSESKSVQFRHQLFQEYFAGRELAQRFSQGNWLTRRWLALRWQIPWHKWKYTRKSWGRLTPPPSTRWEEATILAAGMIEPAQLKDFLSAVLAQNPTLAARCANEAGVDSPPGMKSAIQNRLQNLLKNPRQRLPLRLEAGKQLGRLGDMRVLKSSGEIQSDSKTVAFIEPDWLPVPSGLFRMGSEPKDIKI